MQNTFILTTPAELSALIKQAIDERLPALAPPPPANPTQETLLKTDVKKLLGLKGDSTLWEWIKAGKCPPPLKKGRRCLWIKKDFEKWLKQA